MNTKLSGSVWTLTSGVYSLSSRSYPQSLQMNNENQSHSSKEKVTSMCKYILCCNHCGYSYQPGLLLLAKVKRKLSRY